MAPPHNLLFACDSWGQGNCCHIYKHLQASQAFHVGMKDAFFGPNSDRKKSANSLTCFYQSELNKSLERRFLPLCSLYPHILEQCRHYSRFDFAGESVPQDQGDGGENRHGGAHGPDPGHLQALD